MRTKEVGVFILLLTVSAGIFGIYYFIQPPATYNDCNLCDAHHYFDLYNFFSQSSGKPLEVQFPYYSRILVPAFASVIPSHNPILCFQIINFIFILLTVVSILWIWRRMNLNWPLMVMGLLWLLFHWTGIVRLNAMDPVTVDVPVYFFEGLLIVIFLTKQWKWLWIIAPVAVFQKESLNAYLFFLLIFAVIQNRWYKQSFPLLPIGGSLALAILFKTLYTIAFPPSSFQDKTALETVVLNFSSFFTHPFQFVRWLTAIFIGFGAFIFVGMLSVSKKNLQHSIFSFFFWMTLASVVLGMIGGGDFTRLTFLGFPFIMTFILLVIKEESQIVQLFSLILSIPVMRIYSQIPDPGKDFYNFAKWYPEFAEPEDVLWWTGYMVLTIIIIFVTKRVVRS